MQNLLAARREPPIAFAFGLFAGLLAMVFMRALGTADLDAEAYEIGVVIAAGAGVVTAWGVRLVRPYPRYRRMSLVMVIGMGALVGIAIQWVLLFRAPRDHAYGLSAGLSTSDGFSWVLAGAPIGALPALVAAGLLAGVERLFTHGAYDARERLFFPFATVSALLGGVAVGLVGPREKLLVCGVIALSLIALCEIAIADLTRAQWLRRVFEGSDPAHEVVPLSHINEARGLPLVVAGVVPLSVIMQSEGASSYRTAARIPLAATGMTIKEALAPLGRRRVMVSLAIVLTLARVGALVCGAL